MKAVARPPCLLALLLLGAGCGGGGDEPSPTPPAASSAAAADFPSARGKALSDLGDSAPEGPVLSPSVSVLQKGANRFAFALFDTARKRISGASAAVYTARADGTGLRGPYPAQVQSTAVQPQFESRNTAQDPESTGSLYVARVPFSRRGRQVVTALVRLDGRLVSAGRVSVEVGARGALPPDVGERAVAVHTPTREDVAGDLGQIDTRVPPSSMHGDDLADVLGRRPVLLIFATPALCLSRVCGPVVDVAEQVKQEYGERVAFVHQEIYRGNEVGQGFRPQVRAWRLPTEPWAFAIDRRGRVAARLEGAFSPAELERAVRRALAA